MLRSLLTPEALSNATPPVSSIVVKSAKIIEALETNEEQKIRTSDTKFEDFKKSEGKASSEGARMLRSLH